MLAKDLHYRARGKPFYALHELADVIWQVRRFRDDLNEVYWMGEKNTLPPSQADIYRGALQTVSKLLQTAECDSSCFDEDVYLSALATLLGTIGQDIEVAKMQGVASGSGAVLDEIAKSTMQMKGLISRTRE